MHTWKPITERVENIHKKVRDRVIQIDAERAEIVTESYKANPALLPIYEAIQNYNAEYPAAAE